MGGRGGVVVFVYVPFPPSTRDPDHNSSCHCGLQGWLEAGVGEAGIGRSGQLCKELGLCVHSFARAPLGLRVASINLTASLLVPQALVGSWLGPVPGSLALLRPLG